MRSMQKILCNFGLFLSKFGCHGNSFGSLENLDSIFEFADPKSLSYTQKSWPSQLGNPLTDFDKI